MLMRVLVKSRGALTVRGTEDSRSALLMLEMIWGVGVEEGRGRGDALNKGGGIG
jgi:hypothetical protein